MIKIYVFSVLAIINIICLILDFKWKTEYIIPINILGIILPVLSLLFGLLLTKPSPEEIYRFKKEYDDVKNQIEMVNTTEDSEIKNLFIFELKEKVDKINNKILENRFGLESNWNRYEYSDEIGNMEELEL